MTEHRDLRTRDDAAADQQTKPLGESAVAFHPAMALTAQPDQPGQREPRWIPPGASAAARQTVMGIHTGLAAENATTVRS